MNTAALIFVAFASLLFKSGFLAEQNKFERVRETIAEKEAVVTAMLRENDLQLHNLQLLLVAYKAEGVLEIYVRKNTETNYRKLTAYPICARSGRLGPKRAQGDLQVPEGFYQINRFHPASKFYLSLGLNYPNEADKLKSKTEKPGGDIFIHGACVTVGCLPMTNDKIKEIYLLAMHARNNGQQNIPVYIFPFRMTDENYTAYSSYYETNRDILEGWANLKTGFDKFEQTKKELNISFDKNGNYRF